MSSNLISKALDFLSVPVNTPEDLRFELNCDEKQYCHILFDLLEVANKRAKNRAAKLLANFSKESPRTVYPRMDSLIEKAISSDTIVSWNAMIALGFLAEIDEADQLSRVVPNLVRFLSADSMITAGHAIVALGQIATYREKHRSLIIKSIVNVQNSGRSSECTAILTGKGLLALKPLVPLLTSSQKKQVQKFAEKALSSEMAATQKRAETILKKLKTSLRH